MSTIPIYKVKLNARRIRIAGTNYALLDIDDQLYILHYRSYLNKDIVILGQLKTSNRNHYRIKWFENQSDKDKALKKIMNVQKTLKENARKLKKKLDSVNESKFNKFIENEAEEFKPDAPGFFRAQSRFNKLAKSKSRAKSASLSRKTSKIRLSKSDIKSAPAILIRKSQKRKKSPKSSKSPKLPKLSRSPKLSKSSKSPKLSKSKRRYKLKIVDKLYKF